MRATLTCAAVVAAIAFSGLTAPAADAATINQRQHRQQVRIGRGLASGALTPREAARLERREAAIAHQEAAMRRSDGRLDRVERHVLHEHLDRLSGAIWWQKHDRQRW